jgi:hypothetical protein
LFGCPFSSEKEIIKMLSKVHQEAAHPLLMPGIFAELENVRHTKLVESTINQVEGQIFELDFIADTREGREANAAVQRNKNKRTAWLDLTYLRNSIITWDKQLAKMIQHSEALIKDEFTPNIFADRRLPRLQLVDSEYSDSSGDTVNYLERIVSKDSPCGREEEEAESCKMMQNCGHRIQERLLSIRDDYDEKIRDCTMRLDGMAMATQWSHGETNVEIALATSRDSRHMKSIALVTMIFLPGTFFAVSINVNKHSGVDANLGQSMFSMTFFDWSGSDGSPMVSTYVWIYILATILFTSVTIGAWYYIAIFRYRYREKKDIEG